MYTILKFLQSIIVKQQLLRLVFPLDFTENDYKHVKLFLNVCKKEKIVMISDNYHDIGQLLLLTIIVNSKNWTISIIIVKENITVNRQNW